MDAKGNLYSQEQVDKMTKKEKDGLIYVDEKVGGMNRKERRAYYKKHKRMPGEKP